MAIQYLTWEHGLGDKVAGVAFYRWRDNPTYKGVHGDVMPEYVWDEVRTLCRHLGGRE